MKLCYSIVACCDQLIIHVAQSRSCLLYMYSYKMWSIHSSTVLVGEAFVLETPVLSQLVADFEIESVIHCMFAENRKES